jgi:O-antigen/teichoic acid export membrane protein
MVFFSRLGGLFFVVIIARYLMPESFGIYNLALSISLIFLYFIDSGINQSLLKYVAEALGKKNKKLAKANFRYLLKLKLSMALILSMMLLVLAYPLSFFIFKKPELFFPLMFMSIYIISWSFGSFYHAYFYIIKKIRYLTIRQFLFEIIRIIGVLIFFSFAARKYYILGTLGIITLTTFIVTLYLIYNLRKLSPYLFEKSNEEVDKKRIFKFFIYMGIMGSLLIVFGYIDIIIIGILLSAEYVGFYSAALGLAGGIWSFLNISYILLPLFTQMENHDLETSINKVFKYISLLAIPSIFGILIMGKYLIRAIYGYEYLPTIMPFYILSLLILITPLTSVLISLFSAKEKPKYVINIVIIAIIINIVLDIVLINSFSRISLDLSIAGAAIATVISELVYLFGLIIYTKRKLNVQLKPIHLMKPIISASIMFIILYFLTSKITEMNILMGILIIILGAVIYILIMFLIKGLKKEDIKLIKHILISKSIFSFKNPKKPSS